MRTDRPSRIGQFSYEVIDTKLKRSVDPKHILQLVLYSDLLTEMQGTSPVHAHLVLGDGRTETLRLTDYQYYARRARFRSRHSSTSQPESRATRARRSWGLVAKASSDQAWTGASET